MKKRLSMILGVFLFGILAVFAGFLGEKGGLLFANAQGASTGVVEVDVMGASETTLYLDPVDGDDLNDGTSSSAALKSLNKALVKSSSGGTVYLMNTVTIDEDTVIDSNNVTLTRWYVDSSNNFAGNMFEVGSYTDATTYNQVSLTLKNITLDGAGRNTPASTFEIISGNVLVEDGFSLKNFYINYGSGAEWITAFSCGFRLSNNSSLTVNGGLFDNNNKMSGWGSSGTVICSMGRGTVTINGGEFYRNYTNGSATIVYAANGEIIVNDGIFGAEGKGNRSYNQYALLQASKITINGGTFAYNVGNEGGGGPGGLISSGNIVVNGGTFSYNRSADSTSQASGIFIANSRLEINGGIFENTDVQRLGAVAYVGSSSAVDAEVIIKNATFRKNTGRDSGLFYVVGTQPVTIENCVFTENTTSGGAGGILYLEKTSVVNITSSTFVGNTASIGGVIFGLNGATLNMENCTFDSNKSTGSCEISGTTYYGGGAIRLVSPAGANISECTFVKNTTPTSNNNNNGGAIYASGTIPTNKVTISNTTFEENSSYNGGAVTFANATYIECDFISNKSSFMGGAAIDGYFTNSTFSKNSAAHGGALRVGSARDCVFVENKGSERGGATNFSYCNGCLFEKNTAGLGGATFSTTTENCRFVENTAGQGGAFCSDSSSYIARNCYFEENKATNGNGGAVYFITGSGVNGTCFVYTSDFVSNTSTSSGGALYASTLVSTPNCNFSNNTASVDGGAIGATGVVTVSGGLFEGNTATSGNGGAIVGSTVLVSDCEFLENTATKSGGAVYATGNISVEGCDLYDNLAKENGGAIYVGADVLVGNGNFERNFARGEVASTGYGGAIYVGDGKVEIYDTVIKNNLAKVKGAGIYTTGEKDISLGRDGFKKYVYILGNYIKSTWEGVSFDANGDIVVGSSDIPSDLYVDDITNGLILITDFEEKSKVGLSLGEVISDDTLIAIAKGSNALVSVHTLEMFVLHMGGNFDVYASTIYSGNNKSGVGVYAMPIGTTGVVYVASDYYGDYDGREHSISIDVVSPANYKILYSETQNGTYTETPITVREAGESKEVWFKIEADGITTTAERRVATLNKMDLSFDEGDIDVNFWLGVSLVTNTTDITNFVDAVIYDLEGNAVSCKFVWTGSGVNSVAANSFGSGVTKTVNIVPYNSAKYRTYENVTITSVGVGYDNLYFNSSAFYPTEDFSKYAVPTSVNFATLIEYIKENGTIYFNSSYNISGTQVVTLSKNLNIARYSNSSGAYLGTIINVPSGATLNITAQNANLVFDGGNLPVETEDNLNCNALIVNNGSLNLFGNVTFQNCVNRNITATGSGAAIRSSSNLTLDGVTIKDCTSSAFGAVYTTAGTVNIKNCIITSNTGLYGAGLYLNGAVNIEDTQILTNFATGAEFKGVGLALYGASTVATLQNVKIYKNHLASGVYTEGGNGGAIYVEGATVEITNCEITYNTAFDGAAIYLANGAKLSIEANKINYNEAKNNGGAIYVAQGARLDVIGGEFLFNSALNHGYVVQSNGTTNFVSTTNEDDINVQYNSNAGKTTSYGVISVGGGTTIINGGSFKNNTGSSYTSFYVDGGYLKLYGGTFSNNAGAGSAYVSGKIGISGDSGFDFSTIVIDKLIGKEEAKVYLLGAVDKLPNLTVSVSYVNWYAIVMPEIAEYAPGSEKEWVDIVSKFSLSDPNGAEKDYIFDDYYYFNEEDETYSPLYTIYYYKEENNSTGTPSTYYFDPAQTFGAGTNGDGTTNSPFTTWERVLARTNDGDKIIQVSVWRLYETTTIDGGERSLIRWYASDATGANFGGNMIWISRSGITVTIDNLIVDGNKTKNGSVSEGDYTNYFYALPMITSTVGATLNITGGSQIINNALSTNNARQYTGGSNAKVGSGIYIRLNDGGLTFTLNVKDSAVRHNTIYQPSGSYSDTSGAGIGVDTQANLNNLRINVIIKDSDLSYNSIVYSSTSYSSYYEGKGGVALALRGSYNAMTYKQVYDVKLINNTFTSNTYTTATANCIAGAVYFFKWYDNGYQVPADYLDTILVDNCQFSDNECIFTTGWNGLNTGALAIFNTRNGMDVDIKNCTFDRNQGSRANAIFISHDKFYSDIKISDCSFNSTFGSQYEVAINGNSSNSTNIVCEVPVVLSGLDFSTSNTLRSLHVYRTGYITISDSSFVSNAGSAGPRIENVYNNIDIIRCEVRTDEDSTNYGLYYYADTTIETTRLNIDGCSITGGRYGIYIDSYSLHTIITIKNCELSNPITDAEKADQYGVRIWTRMNSTNDTTSDISVEGCSIENFRSAYVFSCENKQANVSFKDCYVKLNLITTAESYAILVSAYSINMNFVADNCEIVGERAGAIHGIYLYTPHSRVSYLNAKVKNCSINNVIQGIRLYSGNSYYPSIDLEVSNCNFADLDNGIYFYFTTANSYSKCSVTVQGCEVSTAQVAVYIYHSGPSIEVNVKDCNFLTETGVYLYRNPASGVHESSSIVMSNISFRQTAVSTDRHALNIDAAAGRGVEVTAILSDVEIEAYSPTTAQSRGIRLNVTTNMITSNVSIRYAYYGLIVKGGTSNTGSYLNLSGLKIEDCRNSIYVEPDVGDLTIYGAEVVGGYIGLYVLTSTIGLMTIQNVSIDNSYYGMQFSGSTSINTAYKFNVDMKSCSVTNNFYGIYVSGYVFFGSSFKLTNCKIEDNQYGFYFLFTSASIGSSITTKFVNYLTIENTTISNNALSGMYLYSYMYSTNDIFSTIVQFNNTQITDNFASGLVVGTASSSTNPSRVTMNFDDKTLIANNGRAGISVQNTYAGDRLIINGATVKNNSIGISSYTSPNKTYLSNVTITDNNYDIESYRVYLSGNIKVGTVVFHVTGTDPTVHIKEAVTLVNTIKLVPAQNNSTSTNTGVVSIDYDASSAELDAIYNKFTCGLYTLSLSEKLILVSAVKNNIGSSVYFFDPSNRTSKASDANNGKTFNTPIRTWSALMSATRTGDTIYLLSQWNVSSGTYDWGGRILKAYVDPSSPTTASVYQTKMIVKTEANDLTIKNLIVDGNRTNEQSRQTFSPIDVTLTYNGQSYYRTARIFEVAVSSVTSAVVTFDNVEVREVATSGEMFYANNFNLVFNNVYVHDCTHYYENSVIYTTGEYHTVVKDSKFENVRRCVTAVGGTNISPGLVEIKDTKFYNALCYYGTIRVNSNYVNLVVSGCEFKQTGYFRDSNYYTPGVYANPFKTVTVMDTDFLGMHHAIYCNQASSTATRSELIIKNCNVQRNTGHGISMYGYLNATIDGLIIQDSVETYGIIYEIKGGGYIDINRFDSINNDLALAPNPSINQRPAVYFTDASETFTFNVKNSNFVDTQQSLFLISGANNITYNIINCTFSSRFKSEGDRGVAIRHHSTGASIPKINIENVTITDCPRYGLQLRDAIVSIKDTKIVDCNNGIYLQGRITASIGSGVEVSDCNYAIYLYGDVGDVEANLLGVDLHDNMYGVYYSSATFYRNVVKLVDGRISNSRYMAVYAAGASALTELHLLGGTIDATNNKARVSNQAVSIYVMGKVIVSGSPVITAPIYSSPIEGAGNAQVVDGKYGLENDGIYPWVENENGELQSGNWNRHSTTSSYYITAFVDLDITLKYRVSGETNCDRLVIARYVSSSQTNLVNVTGNQTDFTSYSVHLDAGTKLKIYYQKDGSVNSYEDRAFIKDLEIVESASSATADYTLEIQDSSFPWEEIEPGVYRSTQRARGAGNYTNSGYYYIRAVRSIIVSVKVKLSFDNSGCYLTVGRRDGGTKAPNIDASYNGSGKSAEYQEITMFVPSGAYMYLRFSYYNYGTGTEGTAYFKDLNIQRYNAEATPNIYVAGKLEGNAFVNVETLYSMKRGSYVAFDSTGSLSDEEWEATLAHIYLSGFEKVNTIMPFTEKHALANGALKITSFDGSLYENCIFWDPANSTGNANDGNTGSIIAYPVLTWNGVLRTATEKSKIYLISTLTIGANTTIDGTVGSNGRLKVLRYYWSENEKFSGDLIKVTGGTLTIKNVIIDGNKTGNGTLESANYLKFAAYPLTVSSGAGLVLDGCTIQNCYTDKDSGGAIYASGTVVVSNSEFIANSANKFGGAIYSNGTSVTISNTTFKGNFAGTSGGAIAVERVSGTSELVLSKCSFEESIAGSGSGGSIYLSNANAEISDSTFNKNVASDSGAAIYCDGNGTKFSVSGCEFNNNYTTSTDETSSSVGGHTIYVRAMSAVVLIKNSNIDLSYGASNSASTMGNGGAIYVESNKNITISNGNISRTGANNGGAIYIKVTGSDGTITISSLVVDSCVAKGKGIAIYLDSTSTIGKSIWSDIEVKNCYATGEFFHVESSSSVTATNVSIYDTKNANNLNNDAVYTFVMSRNAVLTTNGLSAKNITTATVVKLTLKDASTAKLGGLDLKYNFISGYVVDISAVSNNSVVISDGDISYNYATKDSVVGEILTVKKATLVVKDTLISNNFAITTKNDGAHGVVYILDSSVEFEGVTVSANLSAGPAINVEISDSVLKNETTAKFTDVAIVDNTNISSSTNTNADKLGGGIKLDNVGTVTFTDSDVSGNTSARLGSGILSINNDLNIVNSTISLNKNLSTNTQIASNMFRSNIGFTATGYYVADLAPFTGGAGVAVLGGLLTLSGSKILENTSLGLGGGVLAYAPSIIEKDSTFANNSAEIGGGLFTTFDLQVYDSTFIANKADVGAGIYYGGTLDIARTEFSNNSAESYGSVLYASSDNITLSAYRLLVKDNFVGKNGGIYFNRADGSFQISESEFIGNNSNGDGAAIYTNADVIVSVASFSGNSFGGNSLIYLDGVVNSLLEFVTISGNYGYGKNSSLLHLEGLSRESGVMVLVNCSIYGNKMVNNANIIVENNLHVAIQSTNIFGNINEGEDGKGGAIYVKDGSLLYQDADISDNWAENGSAIYIGTGSTVALFDVSITGNVSKDNSNAFGRNGVIYIEKGAEASFTSSSIYKNELANANGIIYNDGVFNVSKTNIYSNVANNGIVYNSKNGLLSIEDTTITDNKVTNAGALYNEGAVNIISGEIKNNTASANGGGIFNTGKLTLTGGTIAQNVANNGGGVYNSGELILNGGSITANQIKTAGGGVYNSERGTLIFNAGSITENTIVSGSLNTYGLGIANMGQTYMYDGKVSNNFLPDNATDGSYTGSRGGAIYCGDKSYLNVQGGEILDNIAKSGATIYLDAHSVADISNITFDYVSRGFRSTSTRQGSAVYAYNATLSIVDCVVRDTLGQSSGGDGQRVYSENSDVTIKFTTFANNNGAQGLFRFGGGKLYIEECSFTNNTASNASGTGILQLEKIEGLTIKNCVFTGNNSIGDAGAVYVNLDASKYIEATIEGCTFDSNTSGANGGAIYFTGDRTTGTMYKSWALVKDCIFTKNMAKNGGAVYVVGGAAATIEFNNCSFGGWNDANKNDTVESSEVLGNVASENGGAIYFVRNGVSPRQVSVVLSGETTISYNVAALTAGGLYYNYSNTNNTEENYFNLLLKDDSLITIANNYQGATVTNRTWSVGTGVYSNLYVVEGSDLKIIRSNLKKGSSIGLTLLPASGLSLKGTEEIVKGYSSSVPITTSAFDVFFYDQNTFDLKLNSTTNSIVLTQKTATGSEMYAEVSDKVYAMDGTKKGFSASDVKVFNGTNNMTITFSNKQDGEFSEESPTYTARGTYTIWYKIVDNTGSKPTVTGSVLLKITGKILTVQEAPIARINSGEQLKDAVFSSGRVTSDGSAVAGTWAFEAGNTTPSSTTQTYKVVFTPGNSDIYENVATTYINVEISYEKVYYYSAEGVTSGFYIDSEFTKFTGINTLKNMVAAMQELGTIYFASTYTVGSVAGLVEENISFRYKIFFARYKGYVDGPIISLPQNTLRRGLTLNGGSGELVIDGRMGSSAWKATQALFDNYGELVLGANVSIYNVCNVGGGAAVVYNHTGATLYLNGTTIYGTGSNGEEYSRGGAIFNEGTLTINGGDYRENYALGGEDKEYTALGGFVYNSKGTITINGGMFSGNEADNGGAIYSAGGSVLLNGGDLILNHATQNGGAIYLTDDASLTLNGSNLVFNTAGVKGGAIFSDEAVVYLNDTNLLYNSIVGFPQAQTFSQENAQSDLLAIAVSVLLSIAIVGSIVVLCDHTIRKRKLFFEIKNKK